MPSSKLYKNDRFSDVVIRATTQDVSPEADANKTQDRSTISAVSADSAEDVNERVVFQYPAHQQLLAEVSDYFAALLENWCRSNPQQAKPVVTLRIQASEVQLAEALLHFVYFRQTPPELKPQELLGLLRLADEYDVAGCLEACVKELTGLKPRAWDNALLQEAFRLPDPLLANAACQPLVASIHSTLLTRMSNFQDIWQAQNEAYRFFLQLPLRYVKELLGSDLLQVSHENAVLLALADWVSSNTGDGAPDQEVQALGNEVLPLVRLPLISSSMMGQLLSFKCFSGCKCLPQLLACTLRYKMAGRDDQQAMVAEPDLPLRLNPRSPMPKQRAAETVRCDVPLPELEAAVQQASTSLQDRSIRVHTSQIFQGLSVSAMLRLCPDGSMWCRLRWHPHAVSKEIRDMLLRFSLKWCVSFDKYSNPWGGDAALSLFANDTPGMSNEIQLFRASDTPLPRLREYATQDSVKLSIMLYHLE